MHNDISVGLIGYGRAAQIFHAPIIQSVAGLTLRKVVERHSNNAARQYPETETVPDTAELLQDPDIGLIVIATPNHTHFELAQQALLAGKHVVVDKPFTVTSGEGATLVDLARQQKRIISVFQNRRWDGDFMTVRKILESNVLGRLVEYESHFDRFRNVRKEGWREDEGEGTGILYDLGSHLIDQALTLFGLPAMICADIRIQRDTAKVADNFALLLDYGHLKVTLKAGMLVREPDTRFILNGMEGSYVKCGLDPQEEDLKQGRTPDRPDWGMEDPRCWGKLNTTIKGLHVNGSVETLAGAYQSYYTNIAGAINGREELLVKPAEALNTIRVIELAMQSNEQKRALDFSS
ncbi:MAG: oxidoreductase [Balneolales bacterium]